MNSHTVPGAGLEIVQYIISQLPLEIYLLGNLFSQLSHAGLYQFIHVLAMMYRIHKLLLYKVDRAIVKLMYKLYIITLASCLNLCM